LWFNTRQNDHGKGLKELPITEAENIFLFQPHIEFDIFLPMVTIQKFSNQIEAGLVQSFLSDNEIDSILADENARAWVGAPNLVPIRLQVPEEQAEQAKVLLAQFDDAPAASEIVQEPNAKSNRE